MGLLSGIVWALGPVIDYVAMNYRAEAMMLFVLPLSFAVSNFMALRDWVLQKVIPVLSHEERVNRVQSHVKARLARPAEERRFMCTARAPWQNLSTRFADYKSNSDCIFVGDFNNILTLDEEALCVEVEPMVDVGQITQYLVPRGYMLATTLEIKEATLGGLAAAVGMTTASHKYGLLSETVVEYELITGEGDVIKVTKDNEHSELYYAFPWSHGSLGLLLKLKLRIIPVKKFVKVTYTPIKSGLEDYCAKIKQVSLAEDAADFVEATCFSRQEAVVMTGTFSEEAGADGQVNHVSYWFKKWFYIHVREMLQDDKGERIEYIPTYEYIFRHDRGIFWTLKDQFPEKYGNNFFFRLFFGWLCPPKVQFLKMPATPAIRKEMQAQRVYQDIVLPIDCMEEAITLGGNLFEIWPILVYPSRIYDHGSPSKQGQFPQPAQCLSGKNYQMYFDCGIYGIPPSMECLVSRSRQIEDFTRKHRGVPFLYAALYSSREEFNEMLDLNLYEKVRKAYKADQHFPHLWDKTGGCQSHDVEELLSEEQDSLEAKKLK